MNKSWLYLGAIGSLSALVTSCGDGGKQAAAPTPNPSASPATTPTAPAAAPVAPPVVPSTPVAVIPTVPGVVPKPNSSATALAKQSAANLATVGLIQPTDADNWARTVAKGRSDPFATLALQPIPAIDLKNPLGMPANKKNSSIDLRAIKGIAPQVIKTSSIAAIKPSVTGGGSISISQIPKSGVTSKLPKIAIAMKPSSGAVNSAIIGKQNTAIKPVLTPAIRPSTVVAIRPLPQPFGKPGTGSTGSMEPVLARTVGVSGVIQVDGKTQVIVKLPNESFSRYVDVGDRIYDGKIKIKRVEGEETLSPTVIFEEVGVEVSRRVGDTGTVAQESKPEPKQESKPAPKVESKPAPKLESKPESKPE